MKVETCSPLPSLPRPRPRDARRPLFFLTAIGDPGRQYFRKQAQRVRDIAERADPFTKKPLLTLAEQ
jgi:hypothetical protein